MFVNVFILFFKNHIVLSFKSFEIINACQLVSGDTCKSLYFQWKPYNFIETIVFPIENHIISLKPLYFQWKTI